MDTQSLNMFKRMLKEALLAALNTGLSLDVAAYTARDLRAVFAPSLFNKALAPSDDFVSHAAFGLKSVGPTTPRATPREIVVSLELTDCGCRPGDYALKIRMYVKATGEPLSDVAYTARAGKLVEVSAFSEQVRAAFGMTPATLTKFLTAACDSPDRSKRQAAHLHRFWH
jgi:hypothetical protein